MNIIGPMNTVDTVFDFATSPELSGAYSLATTILNGTTYIYVSGVDDNGIQILSLNADGTLNEVGSFSDTAATFLDGPRSLDIVELGGNKFLAVGGRDDHGVTVFEITQSGPTEGQLVLADTIADGSGNLLTAPYEVQSFQTPNGSFIAVTAENSDAVSIYSVASDGGLTLIDSAQDLSNPDFRLNGAEGIEIYSVGNKTFLYVAGEADDGITIFEIETDGTLTFVDSIGIGTSYTSGISAGQFNGQDILLVPNSSGEDLSVYSIAADGTLSLLEFYETDTNAGIRNPYNAKIIEIDGVSFIVMGGAYDDSINILSLDDSGNVQLVERLVDSTLLNGVQDFEHIQMGSRHFLVITAHSGDRVTTVEIGAGDDPLVGTSNDDRIVGADGDDDLIGRAGDDELVGGRGDDVLSGRGGNDTLNGGRDADVLIGGGGNDVLEGGLHGDVLIGGAGKDTASYLTSTGAVNVNLTTGVATGGDATGDALFDIENLTGSSKHDVLTGDGNANVLIGGDGNDTLDGLSGHDKLNGDAGRDLLNGGGGNDTIKGGDQHDTLNGGGGADDLSGGRGQDSLDGGSSDDVLNGGGSHDTLNGGTGNDTLNGGSGQDRFVFNNNFGTDIVEDFADGHDRIDFSGHSGITDIGDLTIVQIGGSTFVIAGSDSIELQNVNSGDITGADFLF